MTAQDTPIWLPAVRPPLGRTGWEGAAPIADAVRGEEGGAGRDVQAGTRCPVPCCWDGTTAHQGHTSPPWSPQCHLEGCSGTVCPMPEPPCAMADPGERGLRGPCKAPCPGTPHCCPHGSCTVRPAPGGFTALCPPDQPTLCKSKLIRLHGYRHRNMRCILSLSINALYHPIKLIKKQSSSSHQVPRLNIINFILWLMIVSADGEHAS